MNSFGHCSTSATRREAHPARTRHSIGPHPPHCEWPRGPFWARVRTQKGGSGGFAPPNLRTVYALTLNGVALAVSLPAGLTIAATPPTGASPECGSPSLSATPGSSTSVLAGARGFHGQTCRLTAPVRAQGGADTPTTGTVGSAEGGAGNGANAQSTALARINLPVARRSRAPSRTATAAHLDRRRPAGRYPRKGYSSACRPATPLRPYMDQPPLYHPGGRCLSAARRCCSPAAAARRSGG
jgi:hypothetical protein